jgi:hypothetical protein
MIQFVQLCCPEICKYGYIRCQWLDMKVVEELRVFKEHSYRPEPDRYPQLLCSPGQVLIGLEPAVGTSCHAGNEDGKVHRMSEELQRGVYFCLIDFRQWPVDEMDSTKTG